MITTNLNRLPISILFLIITLVFADCHSSYHLELIKVKKQSTSSLQIKNITKNAERQIMAEQPSYLLLRAHNSFNKDSVVKGTLNISVKRLYDQEIKIAFPLPEVMRKMRLEKSLRPEPAKNEGISKEKFNKLAVWGFGLAVLSLLLLAFVIASACCPETSFIVILAIAFASCITSIILNNKAKRQIKDNHERGKGFIKVANACLTVFAIGLFILSVYFLLGY